ncbi:MAG: branched-chain amino acid ABC transporter substrate-binding protein [Roseibium sp.]|nr:branched-chain amino acid ABC transporter substrate-binding protein [Roseibium sp.]
MNSFRHAAALWFLAAVLFSVPARAETVIGIAGPMSGEFAAFGAQMRAGAEMAAADLNAAGGVLGEPLVLEFGDDACEAEKATALANQMIGREAVFVVGHFCFGASMAASEVYAGQQIVQMSPATTLPRFTDGRPGPGIYRLAPRDDEQAPVAGRFLAETYQGQRIAIVHDRTAYGKGLADAVKAVMNGLGQTEVLYTGVDGGQPDYSALVTQLQLEGVEVLFFGGYHLEAAAIVADLSERGLNTVLVSGDALATDEFWALAGPAGEGALLILPPDPRLFPDAKGIVDRLADAETPAGGYDLRTYAAIQVFAQAAEAAGSLEHGALVSALDSGTFDTVIGPVSFDDNGDMTLPGFIVYEWRGGTYQPR